MKRSEMVKAIYNRLNGTPLSEYWAEEILKTVEEFGMLPPIESGRTVHDLNLNVPEWESEDE